jgi:hypothetical protein
MVATWLPPELVVTQPYSMGPVTRWDPPMPRGCTAPAMGTVLQMDDRISTGSRGLPNGAEMAILGAFIAPAKVQRAAQMQGERGIIMSRPKGLIELIGDTQPKRLSQSDQDCEAAQRDQVLGLGPAVTLADLLAAAEDDDES